MSTAYLLERAWIGGAVQDDVLVEIEGALITSVTPASQFGHFPAVATAEKSRNRRLTGDSYTHLPGLTLPGLANTHSHAFHRALRGRTQRERGTFWTWREQMYDVAGRLDPDSSYALARATYAEMVAAGYTSVGEFHYLHHRPDGAPYDDPNLMGDALAAAARDAGIRIALLDTCYLAGGFGEPLSAEQRRFGDTDVDAWVDRASRRAPAGPGVVLGAAVH
ncbi:formimidoylglutamate deiminase, partial [Nocardioides sp.]